MKSLRSMVKSAKKCNFQSHSQFFVACLYFREGHCGLDWRPWRAGSGPRAIVWRPLVNGLRLTKELETTPFRSQRSRFRRLMAGEDRTRRVQSRELILKQHHNILRDVLDVVPGGRTLEALQVWLVPP